MKQAVELDLKIENGRDGQMVALAYISGDLSVGNVGTVKKFFAQLLDAESDSHLVLHDVAAIDASFFQLWYSFAKRSIENKFFTQLDLSQAKLALQHAKCIGFDRVSLFRQCLEKGH